MRKSNFRILACAIMLGLLGSAQVFAAEKLDLENMDKYVSTAARQEMSKVSTPANMVVITNEEIMAKGYRNVLDALDNIPGVQVSRPGYGGGWERVYIQGDSRVLVLMDGRRLSSHLGNMPEGFTNGNSTYDLGTLPDPEIIDRIEVVKGAGAAMYGSDAVGGVINIITKLPVKDEVILEGQMGSFKTYKYNGILTGKRGKWGLLVAGGTYHQKDFDYKDGGSKMMDNSKYELDSLGLKVTGEFTGTDRLVLHYQHTFKEGGLPFGIKGLGFDKVGYGERLQNSISADYTWNTETPGNTGGIKVYHHYSDETFTTNYEGSATHRKISENRDGVQAYQNIAIGRKNLMTVGFSHEKSKFGNEEGSFLTNPEDMTNTAFFLTDNWNFNDKTSLNVGVRYDHYNKFGSETTLHAGLNQKVGKKGHAYLSWGQVFNVPTAVQLYGNGEYLDFRHVGNPDLKAEKGYNWNLGYEANLNEKTNIGVNFFYSKLDDAIAVGIVSESDESFISRNIGKLTKRGMELSFKHKFSDKWALNGSYTYMAADNEQDETIRDYYFAPNSYKLGVSYTTKKWDVNLMARAATGLAGGEYFNRSSYLTMDLAARYKINKDWEVFGKVYNLTNAAYATRALADKGLSAYPMPSRWFVLGVKYKF